VKDAKIDIQMKKLFSYQVIIGMNSNFLVGIASYIYKDYLLFAICILLFLTTIVSYYISKRLKFDYGLHLMLIAYFVCFFYAAFTHLVTHPLILVYPIICGLAILYSRNNLVRLFYALLCFGACAITVYLQQVHFGATNFQSEILASILICLGLMVAFPIIIMINSNILYRYQEELEEKNEKLNAYISSNLQLENFAHLASHELKTPLNNITTLTSLLKKKTENRLEEKESEIMELVTSEVGKMNKLIADLLEFSLVKNTEIKFEKINIDQLLDQLLKRYYQKSNSFIKKEINFSEIYGHEELLAQLFTNLIDNAIKFSRKNEDPIIEIVGSENKNSYLISIADNGIGIKNEYKERVFLIFKKLHHNTQYPGTGIGLSICKSIVERHGGNIWIEDNPMGGSIFKFTLSKL